MISHGGKGNFLAAHYDWLVLGVGAAALVGAGAFFACSLGQDADEEAAAETAQLNARKPHKTGVDELDLTTYQLALRGARTPATLAEVSEKEASFLASDRRVKCVCGKVISGDVKAVPKCPFCGVAQETEKPIVLDADGDGMPDTWEKRFGLNPHDPSDAAKDGDRDDFTNLEEFQAKTDPTDAKDHPDYLDSLTIQLPLKETYLPFVFTKATKIPSGWRCEFFDAKKKDVKRGNTGYVTAKVGEEIAGSGFTVKTYEEKSAKREKKGMKGMFFNVDVSEVKLERKTDGKVVTVVIGSPKTSKPVPVDVQATLLYARGGGKTIEAVPGTEFELSGEKYRISEVKAVGKGAKVTVEKILSGKKHILEALVQ